MNNLKIKGNEELIKVPVKAGDMVFVKYDKYHKPIIEVFNEVIPI